MIKRLSKKLFTRQTAYLGIALLAGAFLLLLLQGFIHATSDMPFCASCHEMDDHVRELKSSTHWNNRNGYHTKCAECHISPGFAGMVEAKWKGLHEVIVHYADNPLRNPEKWRNRRNELRKKVVREMPQSVCIKCHDVDSMKPSTKEAEKAHSTITPKMKCLDCHSVEGQSYLVHNKVPPWMAK